MRLRLRRLGQLLKNKSNFLVISDEQTSFNCGIGTRLWTCFGSALLPPLSRTSTSGQMPGFSQTACLFTLSSILGLQTLHSRS